MSERRENKWSTYGFRLLINTVSHPFEYAKILIQIGYEPIPPKPSHTFFGKPALRLPNIFQYVKHIKTVDGFTGCYRGLEAKVCGSILSAIATQKVTDYFDDERIALEEAEEAETDVELVRRKRFLRQMRNDIVTRATTIIVSQPFHVITVRVMAQFIGREVKYRGIFGCIGEVYTQNGILGFFSGLIPRLLGDILTVVLANTLTYVINTYLVEEKELQVYTSATMMFIATAVTYPFQVVSNCMAVNKSGLMAGSPPFMPHYGTWVNCWTDLSNRNQLKRGSSLLVRYYVGPQFAIESRVMPKMSNLKY